MIESIEISASGETAHVGLRYSFLRILSRPSWLYADLCQDCGTIARFFVKETNKPWIRG